MWQHKPRQNKPEQVKRRCHRCRGAGRAPCEICKGSGEVMKGRDIHGKQLFARCDGCFGLKTIRCSVCGGEGFL